MLSPCSIESHDCALAPEFPWGEHKAAEIQMLLLQPSTPLGTLQRGRNLLSHDAASDVGVFESALEKARPLIRHQDRKERARQFRPDLAPLLIDQEHDPLDDHKREILCFRRLLDILEVPECRTIS